jgi:hypothetical protein
MGTTESLDDILEHYGIKGMRWGVRRTEAQLARARGEKKSGKLTKTPKNMQSKDAATVKKAKAKITKEGDTSALSNDELRAVVQRMNLEAQYKNMGKSQQKNGKSAIKEMKQTQHKMNEVMKFINSPAGKAVSEGVKIAIRQMTPMDFSDLKL